jgi:hypothetical protein
MTENPLTKSQHDLFKALRAALRAGELCVVLCERRDGSGHGAVVCGLVESTKSMFPLAVLADAEALSHLITPSDAAGGEPVLIELEVSDGEPSATASDPFQFPGSAPPSKPDPSAN